jgi:2-dehydro-3-deoxyphosphogalactonate aldolase
VDEAAAAGAQLIVSPDANPGVIAAAKAAGLTSLPGAFTPTEAFSALAAGADALKLFPADVLGPASLRAWRPVLPAGTAVLPVGGVDAASVAQWRAAGAAGFGIGSAVYRPGDSPEQVRPRALEFVQAWRAIDPGETRPPG